MTKPRLCSLISWVSINFIDTKQKPKKSSTYAQISDFDKIQIRQFINNWFESDAYKAELCWIEISSNDENKRILELASTPLLLTLICISFESLLSFPSNKAEIYKDALDVLLKRWDSSRNIKRSEIYKELSLRKKETLLSQIAFKTFSKNDYFFRRITIEKHIQDFILNLNNINVNEIEFDSQRILMAVEAQHGLIVERAKDIFSFSHLTLQEYFTAKYFIDNLMRENVANVMNENILNPRWKEVFLIAACMLNEADEFLLKMQNEILKKFSEVNFNYFMETIFCVIRTDTFFPIEIKKCLALYYVLDLDQVRESAIRDNLQLTKIRTNILALTNAISKSYSKKESYSPVISLWEHISDDNMIKFANDLNKAINFNSTIIVERGKSLKLNKSLVELLNNYIQSNKTLVDCLNSDCYLSNETKLLIHSRLLNEKYIS